MSRSVIQADAAAGTEGEKEDEDAILEAALAELGIGPEGSEQQQQQEEEQQEQQEPEEQRQPETPATAAAQPAPPAAAAVPTAPAPRPMPECPLPLDEFVEAAAPDNLTCPITLHLLDDPVFLAADGCTYSRVAIEAHLAHCRSRELLGWCCESKRTDSI